MVYFRRSDDVSVLQVGKREVTELRKRGIHSVGQMFDTPYGKIEDLPRAYEILQAMALGRRNFGLLEWGMEMAAKKGRLLWSLDDGCLTVWGNGRMPDYTSELLPPWERFKAEIGTVRIEEEVSNVGARAFAGCPKLREVYLAEKVDRIGFGAFADCPALETVEASGPLINWRQEGSGIRVGMKAFSNTPWQKKNREDFYIADGMLLEYFGDSREPVIPEGVVEIAPMVFEGYPIRRVTFPGTLRRIGQFAFRGTQLRELVIPKRVEQIDSWAFGESGVESVLLCNTRVRIAPDAFSGTAVDGWRPVRGRWPSIFSLVPVPIPECRDYQRLEVGLMRPIGVRPFYSGCALLRLLRTGSMVFRICLDEQAGRVEYIQAFAEKPDDGLFTQLMYPCLESGGTVGIWRDSTTWLESGDIIGCVKEGLWPPKKGRYRWYCAPYRSCGEYDMPIDLLWEFMKKNPQYSVDTIDECIEKDKSRIFVPL